jgi:hypothetical protein
MRNPHNPSIFCRIARLSGSIAENLRQNGKRPGDLLKGNRPTAMLGTARIRPEMDELSARALVGPGS